MKVAIRRVVEAQEALQTLSTAKFKATHAYKLSKFITAAQAEQKAFDDARNPTILKYSSDGRKVDDDKMQLFVDDLTELLEKEVELPDFEFKVEELNDMEISPAHLIQLEWLLNS